jgi:hypothetical protein
MSPAASNVTVGLVDGVGAVPVPEGRDPVGVAAPVGVGAAVVEPVPPDSAAGPWAAGQPARTTAAMANAVATERDRILEPGVTIIKHCSDA